MRSGGLVRRYPEGRIAPTFASLNYALADIGGGDALLVNGSNFRPGTAVYIGGTLVTTTFVSASQLSIVTPAKAAGAYDLSIVLPDGTSVLAPAAYEAWSPLQIASIDGYFDSRKGVSVSGSNVTTWTEQSRSAAYTSQSGREPTLVTNVFASTKPAIRFTKGTLNQWVRSGTRRALSSGLSVFFVTKWTSTDITDNDNPNNCPLTLVGDSTASVAGCWGAYGGYLCSASLGVNNVAADITTLNDGVTRLLGWTHGSSPTNEIAYISNVADSYANFPLTYRSYGWDTIGCGRSSSGTATTGGDGWDGDVGAVVIAAAVMSSDERGKLYTWSKSSFGAA